MRETDPENLVYVGAPNEDVTITLTQNGTFFLVNCRKDGVKQTVTKGKPIEFKLKPNGDSTIVQFSFRFSTPTGGSYTVAVSEVEGSPTNGTHTFDQEGILPVIIDYTFFAE